MRLEDTEQYKLGRNGELLIHSFAIEYGCTAFDIGGTASGAAPMLQSKHKNIIAPDALHLRNVPLWAEYKTKSVFYDHVNGRHDPSGNRIPPCLGHGINRRAYEDYRRADELMPVTLWFLCITAAQLHVASLSELGEPISSTRPELYNVVNFPLVRMHHVASFDKGRLQQFFRKDRLHEGLPTEAERKALLHWLRPRQMQFDAFTEHFLIWREQCWANR